MGNKVEVEITLTDVENDQGRMIPGVSARCTKCDLTVEVYGQADNSKRRACMLLKEDCPEDETNFYVLEDE